VAEKTTPVDLPTPAPARQVVNTRRCALTYAIDGISPTAVSRVEAYATRDEGKTWQRLGDDPDRQSPVDLQLPDDGLYGVIVIVSTAHQSSSAPSPGEAPDWWVEVDTLAPEVKLESAAPGTGDDAGMQLLRWSVRDANLLPDSVEVAWAPAPEGPWQIIAKGLRADGQYRWPVPRETGPRVFLKIEVPDRAGNVGRFVTPQPVTVEAPRPRARVIGINPAAVRP
jgi:hypothetical protein